jgi:hypothetical protein
MKIGVFATFMSPIPGPQMIRDFGRSANHIGLDSIWIGEHVVLFDRNTFVYPAAQLSPAFRSPWPYRAGYAVGRERPRCQGAPCLLWRQGTRRWRSASISASALAGTMRRSRPAAIARRIVAGAAMSSWRSCVGSGPSR